VEKSETGHWVLLNLEIRDGKSKSVYALSGLYLAVKLEIGIKAIAINYAGI